MIPSLGSSLGKVPRLSMTPWMVLCERLRQTGKGLEVLTADSLSLSSDGEKEQGG